MLMEESTASQKHGIKMNVWNRIPEDKEPDFPGAKFKFLRCLSCQHEDFSENGYDLGIYTCNGCDTPVRISIRNTNLAKP
ncbi:hypothetical protein LMH73_028370 [Vibrio splendidus]|nr:hypothetical protein [Vibrio splendidus]